MPLYVPNYLRQLPSGLYGVVVDGATQTLYVATTGDDNNPGTQALPFLTLQKAVDVAKNCLGLGTGIYIYVAAGTYAGFILTSNGLPFNAIDTIGLPPGIVISGGWGGGTTTITAAAGGLASIVVNGWGANVTLQGTITIQGTGHGLFAYAGGTIVLNSTGITFGATTNAHMHADSFGWINVQAGYTINGGGTAHLECSLRPAITYDEHAMTVTLTGAPVFSVAFVHAQDLALIYCNSNFISFNGAAGAPTRRFSLTSGAVLDTTNGSDTYFPGTVAGQMLNGARYMPVPLPAISGLTGFGAGATAALRGGSTEREGVVEITTGAGPAAAGSFVLSPATVAPNGFVVLWTLLPGSAAWNARAVAQQGQTYSTTSVGFTVDNNGVAFPAGTLDVMYQVISPGRS